MFPNKGGRWEALEKAFKGGRPDAQAAAKEVVEINSRTHQKNDIMDRT